MGLRRKNIIFTVAAIAAGIMLSLVAAEISIRFYNQISHQRARPIWIPDPTFGYLHTPNNRFLYEIDAGDKRLSEWHQTNTSGFLSEEITISKPNNVYRVAFLGDSFTEALQVSREKNFCYQLKGLLQKDNRFAQDIEIINAGLSGYSPIKEFQMYRYKVDKFDPDIVVLQLFANDVFENNITVAQSILDEQRLPNRIHPFFIKKYRDGAREHKWNNLKWNAHHFLIEKSRLYEYLFIKIVKSNKSTQYHKRMTSIPQYDAINQFYITQENSPLFQDREFRRKAWELTEYYIQALRKLVEARGNKLVILYIPYHEQLNAEDYNAEENYHYSKVFNTFFNKQLNDFSEKYNVDYVDMLPYFKQYSFTDIYLRQDFHLTEKGHQVVAEALFKTITGQK